MISNLRLNFCQKMFVKLKWDLNFEFPVLPLDIYLKAIIFITLWSDFRCDVTFDFWTFEQLCWCNDFLVLNHNKTRQNIVGLSFFIANNFHFTKKNRTVKNSSNCNNHYLNSAKPSQFDELFSNSNNHFKNSLNCNSHKLNNAKPSQFDELFSNTVKILTFDFWQNFTCSLETGDGGIIITSVLGFEEVDSRRSRGSNLLIELSEDPKPESEVADAIITSVSPVALLLSVVSMMDVTDNCSATTLQIEDFLLNSSFQRECCWKFFRQFAIWQLFFVNSQKVGENATWLQKVNKQNQKSNSVVVARLTYVDDSIKRLDMNLQV